MNGRENNAQTTAAGKVFSQSFNATLRQTPVSDPLSVTAEAKTGGNEISDSPHHTASAKQRRGRQSSGLRCSRFVQTIIMLPAGEEKHQC